MAEAKKDKKVRVVTAPLVIVRLNSGQAMHLSRGAELPEETSDESRKNLEDLGFLGDEAPGDGSTE